MTALRALFQIRQRRLVRRPSSSREDTGMDISRAIRSALVGWAGMTGLIFLGRRSSITQMDVINMEGSLFAEPNSATAEVIGFFTHIAMSL